MKALPPPRAMARLAAWPSLWERAVWCDRLTARPSEKLSPMLSARETVCAWPRVTECDRVTPQAWLVPEDTVWPPPTESAAPTVFAVPQLSPLPVDWNPP